MLHFSLCYFFVNDTATTEIYTLSLHDALPICCLADRLRRCRDDGHEVPHRHRLPFRHRDLPQHAVGAGDRKSTRLNSSHQIISYAVFCLKKKTTEMKNITTRPPRNTRHH